MVLALQEPETPVQPAADGTGRKGVAHVTGHADDGHDGNQDEDLGQPSPAEGA